MRIKGKEYRILKTYLDSYLVVSEIGFDTRTIPKLEIVK